MAESKESSGTQIGFDVLPANGIPHEAEEKKKLFYTEEELLVIGEGDLSRGLERLALSAAQSKDVKADPKERPFQGAIDAFYSPLAEFNLPQGTKQN